MQKNANILNKRASFDYEILDKYNAGIVLTGTEIKSIRLARTIETYPILNRIFLLFKKMYKI